MTDIRTQSIQDQGLAEMDQPAAVNTSIVTDRFPFERDTCGLDAIERTSFDLDGVICAHLVVGWLVDGTKRQRSELGRFWQKRRLSDWEHCAADVARDPANLADYFFA